MNGPWEVQELLKLCANLQVLYLCEVGLGKDSTFVLESSAEGGGVSVPSNYKGMYVLFDGPSAHSCVWE